MGIMKTLRKRRMEAKAELKAAKSRVKAEVKAASKAQQRQQKLLAKQEKLLIKSEEKGLKRKRKHEEKRAKQELAKIRAGKINASTINRYAGIIRTAAPLLLPLVYRAIVSGRQALEQRRATKAGVSADEMAAFSGHGAPLKARIAGVRNTLEDVDVPSGFKRDVNDRLDELEAAVDNAEYMTDQQRRRAHASISSDIDSVTQEIQERL
ncbi:hypothetical protein G7Y31_11190 [Corynebacterium lizhenjunii]|uniref:Uncharacterized protein n=1 Tax=Corynebacterium lizhenjunii TaxID=2709394 RepID=A0A7T0KEC5_9CORY|nr:DUF6474 family protein [Corynebacterium lizhenjunii]QPK79042.1 hypothetical protein G7Y31_11190 [Corynebacterium lizhenjunii]